MPWYIPLSILTLSAFLMELCFTMISPFLPVYLVQELSVPSAEVHTWAGAVYSVTFFISGFMGPVWGAVADRKSRKLMAIRASVCLAITYVMCGLVTTPGELFAVRFLQGFSAGLYPALLSIVAVSMPAAKIGLAMGLMQGGMTVGGIAGPFCGGVLAEFFGMRPAFFVAGVALFVVAFLVIFLIKEAPHKPSTEPLKLFDFSVIRSKTIMRLLLVSTVIYASLFSIQPILPLYIAELNGSMDSVMLVAGSVFSVCGVSIMIASPLIGAAGQKWGFSKALIVCLLLSGVLIAAQVLASTVEGFTFWRFIGGFAVAGLIPTVNSLLSVHTPEEVRGKVFGFAFLFGHIGMAGGPMVASELSAHVGYAPVIALSGFILLPLALYLVWVVRNSSVRS